MQGVTFNRDRKFDLQLSAALVAEQRLAEFFSTAKLEKIELKTETYQWRRTGNICIEYRRLGKPSGISVTEADHWVHELCTDDGAHLCYFVFSVPRLKEICREALRAGRGFQGGGDGGEFDGVLLSIRDLLGLMK